MIDRDREIIKAYENGTRSGLIAEQFDVSKSLVLHILRREGVERRREGRQRRYDYDALVDAYLETRSTGKVAERFGCSRDTVLRALHMQGVDVDTPEPKVDRREVVSLYVDKGLTQIEIADELDVSQSTVANHLRSAGLDYRHRGARADGE